MSLSAQREAFTRAWQAARPPENLRFSDWASKHFRLVDDGSNERFRPWKFQLGILDAMGDPLIERVSVIKAARTGYTKSLVATIGAFAANDPSPMMLLMPTDDDTRGIVVDEIDPAFKAIPALRGLMVQGRMDGRN
ncbi:MAG TPA: phage terminase large subunit family protein, partial [Devosia sp.]|nr:phage terminase large subunit family protein [Devosia sp.]